MSDCQTFDYKSITVILFNTGTKSDSEAYYSWLLWHEFSPQDWYNANSEVLSRSVVSGVQDSSLLFDMTKYKKQVQDMLAAHHDLFTAFKQIHDQYIEDPKTWQAEYNEKGRDVLIIIKRWENNLCAKSEGSRYGKFSDNLADKFWNEIRAIFPKIDYIGMEYK